MSLYAFGSNGNHQLSLSHDEDLPTPQPCKFTTPPPSTPPKQIACGGNHTLLLYPNGTVFSTGLNTSGETAFPHNDSTPEHVQLFTQLPPPPPTEHSEPTWTLVAAGWSCSFLVDTQNRLFSLGSGHKGELGHGEGITQKHLTISSQPDFSDSSFQLILPLEGDEDVVQLNATVTHSLLVTSHGRVFGWGAARKGQLGTPTVSAVWQPRIVTWAGMFKVRHAVCGRDFSVLVGDGEGEVVVLGKNRYGIEDIPEGVKKVQFSEELVKVGASWGGVHFLLKNGTVIGWGRNDKAQLFSRTAQDGGEKVVDMAIGSEHGVYLTEDQRLFAWGWNEHGNCGKMDGEGGKPVGIVREPHEIPVSSDAKGTGEKCVGFIAAGCASSWLWVR